MVPQAVDYTLSVAVSSGLFGPFIRLRSVLSAFAADSHLCLVASPCVGLA